MRSTSGSAERLQRSAGAWKLEFQQLVYDTPSLLRPRRFAVQGEQAILQQLREFSGHEPLARDAERLFARGALPDGNYLVREGRWYPELRPDAMAEPVVQPIAAVAPGRSGLDELNKRIAALELTVRGLTQSLEGALRTFADPALRPAPAAPLSAPLNAVPLDAPRGPEPQVASASADTAMSAPEPVLAQCIALPTVAALSDLVRSLAGPDAMLASTEPIDWQQLAASQPVFYAVIQDNSGNEAGAMVFELESSLRLAAALLMESDEVVESLLEEKIMSDEMLDAASEVCNTLTSAFNKVSGNRHVRAGKLESLSQERLAAIARARKRDDYRYTQGGRLSMIAR